MVENVQCPVCTLFLHAGMNLSDHLETHPKEQVIKALVQLTLSGGKDEVANLLAGARKPEVEGTAIVEKEHDLSNCSINTIKSSASSSISNFSTSASFSAIRASSIAISTGTASCPEKQLETVSPSTSNGFTKSSNGKNPQSVPQAYQHISNAASKKTVANQNEQPAAPTDFSLFTSNRAPEQQQQQLSRQSSISQLEPQSKLPIQSLIAPIGTQPQRTSLLPPPPPTAFMLQQQQTISATTPRHAHGNQQPTQQAQNLKIMYSSALPPPPPLQLFSYQAAPQPQHQKPPPAYGTAISQIRSQHNPNKQNAAMTQQHHNQHVRVHGPTSSGSSGTSSGTKDMSTPLKLNDNPAPAALGPPAVQHSFKSFQEAMLSSAAFAPSHKTANMHHRSAATMDDKPPPPPPPPLPPPQLAIQPQMFSNRQTSSPFTSILGASASPPLSVLRYAESPVAHYMERDNGDFIVQESPKHIVQCVEKDNGEFSVIERIYQSPPSVLHIHEDDDDEDAENENRSSENADTSKGKEHGNNDEQLEEFLSFSRLSAEKGQSSPQTDRVNEAFAAPAGSTSSHSFSSVSSSASSTSSGRKKSSKNSITVLSDVQLDLNEYLDLVGNIIASNKNAKNKARAALFPMVKIEKVEPQEEEDDYMQQTVSEPLQSTTTTTKPTNIPPAIAKNNETEILVENKSNKDKTSLIEIDDEKPTTTKLTQKYPDCSEQSKSAACSSHATSVIRMATTINTTSSASIKTAKNSSQQRQEAASEAEHVEVVDVPQPMQEIPTVEDLSQHKPTEYPKIPRMIAKRGPKKLVIKPKLTKLPSVSSANDEQPTTSAKAKWHVMEKEQDQRCHLQPSRPQAQSPTQLYPPVELDSAVFIKSEPNTSGSGSILEQQLKLGQSNTQISVIPQLNERSDELQLEIKKEIKHKFDSLYSSSNSNENVADDARVLLDFANSKKHTSAAMSGNFPSSSSIFAHAAATSMAIPNPVTLHCEEEFVANDASDNIVQEIVISSSYSSQSASDAAVMHTANSVSHLTSDSNQTEHHQHHNHHHHQQQQQQQPNYSEYPFSFLYGGAGNVDAVRNNFSPLYQQSQDITNAATLASGSNSALLEDSTSAHASSSQHHQNRFSVTHSNNASQWYHHHAASAANSDFEAALGVDSSNHAAEGDVGKYLDLDACKQEVKEIQSSTSSSFAAAAENSLAGGCTTDALNIRTDEKMPAKGEISEQESNCDIENSWSQPMYGDISARFFNGWNHEDYFTAQDLSASTANVAGNNRIPKSFDFRLPFEAPASAIVFSSSIGNNNMQLFQQHSDSLPSTSSKSKKKRKRDPNVATKPAIRRVKPTATVTSQQMLNQQIAEPALGLAQQQQHLLLQPQYPTTSATSLVNPDRVVATTPNSLLLKSRKRIYQCVHCPVEFGKLKDRNLHMIQEHNYVRQNRRLICTDQPTSSRVIPSTVTSSELATSSAKMLLPLDYQSVEDSKEGIVKIEALSAEPLPPSTISGTQLDMQTEFIDVKENLAVVPADSVDQKVVETDLDKKANLQRLTTPAPSTKLTLLYRKLVSYNVMTLKQSQNISEHEEKFIENSIFFCYNCRCNFSCVKTYDAHLSTHPAECFTCGKKFSRWRNFSLHLKRHLGWKEFGCNVCDKKFVVRSALVEHMRMHTGHKPLKCKICGKRFKRYSNLTQHRKRHIGQVVRRKEYVCHCGEVLPSLARFIWHKETHDAKPKCCPYCCDRFVHANSLRRHIRLAHSDKFEYTAPMECPMCKQIFAKSSIKAHMATHSMDTQFDCVICNKSFSTKWNLKIHSWVHANRTAKPFKCEHCPKAFVREVDFKNHMNAHKQIKPYTCEYCGCKFIRKYNYMRHRREHHGNKKFTCDLCKKSFHRHYYLIEHRRIHTGERPFQCTICGKSSTTKTNHNKHLKIHHSRDPFTVEA